MLTLISPAKSQDFSAQNFTSSYSLPQFLQQTKELIPELLELSIADIQKIMAVSEKIAELNYNRYRNNRTYCF